MRVAVLVLSACAFAACASDPMLAARGAYSAGDYVAARAAIDELIADDGSNAHLWRAERSMVDLAQAQPKAAIAGLRSARDAYDDAEGSDALGWLGSVLLDDRQMRYQGYDYEKILLRALLGAADLMQGGADAIAYGLQVFEVQQRLMEAYADQSGQKPKLRYKQVAFGNYLRAIVQEGDPLQVEEARRNHGKVAELEPGFRFAKENVERVTSGKHSAKGNGVVHVIALVGRGPYRVEKNEVATQVSLAIAQWIWARSRDRGILPNIAKVPIPGLAYHPDNPQQALVSVDGGAAASTATVTDVEAAARNEFEVMRDAIVARAVLRRAFKILVAEGAKAGVEAGGRRQKDKQATEVANLAIDGLALLWTATEGADLRCWSLLPASFQVLRLELPVGAHTIAVQSGRGGNVGGIAATVDVDVRDGTNSYVLALLPVFGGAPTVMTSHPATAAGSPTEPAPE